MVVLYRFSKMVSLSNLTWKLPWEKPTFYKVRRRCKQLNEVSRSGRAIHGVCRILDSQTTFVKFAEAVNNFTKFVGLANNLWKVCKTSKNFMKLVDWKVGFKCLNVFLYLHFTCLNILIGKHKCFVNTFHVSWILFTNKLNGGRCVQVDKIFGTVKNWSLVALDRWSFYAM